MTIGINLGCGRATFPTTPDNPFTSHLTYALEQGCPEAFDPAVTWINIDRVAGSGVNAVVNLWRLPWAFDGAVRPMGLSNSVDIIFASHIIEHIPHAFQLDPNAHNADPYLMKLAQTNGDMWWGWFYECWRILKPGGKLHIVAPYAFSSGAMGDPTHTRYILPNTFSYFVPNPNAPFDYDLPYQFKQVAVGNAGQGSGMFKATGKSNQLQDQIAALRTALNAFKADDPQAQKITHDIDMLIEAFDEQMTTHIDQITEMYFVFEAVKP